MSAPWELMTVPLPIPSAPTPLARITVIARQDIPETELHARIASSGTIAPPQPPAKVFQDLTLARATVDTKEMAPHALVLQSSPSNTSVRNLERKKELTIESFS